MENLSWIANQEYLGRGIIIGKLGGGLESISYFVTGRSAPSRARKLVEEWNNDRVRTDCMDPEQLKRGTPELLIYNAIRRVGDIFVVSNGAQTDIIANEAAKNSERNPARLLMEAFAHPAWVQERKDGKFTGNYIDLTSFEPDSPNWTPRISGVVKNGVAGLAIARKAEGSDECERQYFEFPLIPGRARFIPTYTGKNVPAGQVIPSFRGEPLEFDISQYQDINAISETVYDFLGPKTAAEGIISPGQDFRVGVSGVAIERKPRPRISYHTINAWKDQQQKLGL
ncbi:MAG: IMP cyclohydrolase [Nanoarchaeota archaeon]|nr:IMP cyclohydrolase [Nanoarchaeota archaeon]